MSVRLAVLALAFASTAVVAAGQTPPSAAPSARVIVELAQPAGAPVAAQRAAIAAAADRVAARLPRGPLDVRRRFTSVPYIVVDADAAVRAALAASPDVVRVMEDKIRRPSLAQSVPLIQGDQAWDAGYDGTGRAVAILDTGVDRNHPFLAGKVIDEACFSSTISGVSQSTCPNGTSQQFGTGAAAPCSIESCLHGTHVAGIAAGTGAPAGQTFSGVARGARIVAVQVFSIVNDAAACGGTAPCAGAYNSDIIAGLEYVQSVAGPLNVVSANMSLGGETFTSACDGEAEKPAIDNLRSVNVATVIASGNGFAGDAIASPACISSAISVGSIEKNNTVSYFSDVAPFLSLFAPGGSINSSVPGGGYAVATGTSMAAPHVAGAWAILRQAAPGASVDTILNAFRSTGLPITDDRLFFGGGSVVPRVSVLQALASIAPVTSPVPSLTSLSPLRVRAGMSGVTLSLTGTGFNALSLATWNGLPLPTTVVSRTALQAAVPIAMMTGTSAQVAVMNPAPGGGTSASITIPIDPPAVLTVSATAVPPSTPVTMTLAGGFGGQSDWLALSQVGSSDRSFVSYTYVGNGVTNRTWTVTMPSTPGQYEFRYFPDNGYIRAGTSPTVTVDASLTPAPSVASLSPSSATTGGPGFTLTVNGSSFTSASVVRWNGSNRTTTFVSASQLTAAIAAADIASAGTAQISVFTPAPGGGTSGALGFLVGTPPVLTIGAASVTAGGSVTVTLTNGFGGQSDWMTFALVSAPNTSYAAYTYVGNGVTTRTWTVTAPSTPGTYEFRLFLNNGYTRAATSAPVTVTAPAVPATLTVNSTSVGTGASVTVTLTGGPGGPSDWMTFAATSAPNTSYVAYTYVGSGVTTRTWTVTAPSTAGTYEFRLFLNNGYNRAATSPAVTVVAAPPSVPVVSSLSPSMAIAGMGLTLTVNGSGFTAASVVHWNGSARPTTFVSSTQLRATIANADVASVGTAQVSVTTPPPGGGTSGSLQFSIVPAPILSVSTPSAAPGSPVTVTLTGGLGGQSDWISFASTSSPNTSFVFYTYIGNGVTTRTWTVTAPSTPGTYEFRLFLNNGYTRAATSVTVTVQ